MNKIVVTYTFYCPLPKKETMKQIDEYIQQGWASRTVEVTKVKQ